MLAPFIWSQACTGKFVWPLPDRGLKNRMHRIVAPTLIVWGNADRIIAPAYAQEFATRIAGAKIELIDKPDTCRISSSPMRWRRRCAEFLGR